MIWLLQCNINSGFKQIILKRQISIFDKFVQSRIRWFMEDWHKNNWYKKLGAKYVPSKLTHDK